MIPFSISQTERPNRITDTKDSQYHCDWARYAGNSLNNPTMSEFFWRIFRNRLFYQGNQWIGPSDTVTFFEDEDGEAKGRERYVQNIIRPFVNQMIGEAKKMSLTFKARSQGNRVINRREKELSRLKAGRILADRYPTMEKYIKNKVPIGKNMEETEEIFRNVWTDMYERDVNNLCNYISEYNQLKKILFDMAAESLAIEGMPVFYNYERGGDMRIKLIQAENFFFDSGATMYDLSDAEFMGDTSYALPTDVYEEYDLPTKTMEEIEKYTKELPIAGPYIQPMPYNYSFLPGRIPVINVEWRDIEKYNYGYVKDQFGYETLARVYKNSYKPKANEKIYFESDLIEPQYQAHKEFMKGKKIRALDVECIRFCKFTPSEVYTGGEGHDIVYDYGIVPFQEKYVDKPTTSEFSYRTVCWGYHDGYISSPIDDIIDPQRLINRMNSIAEAKANKSGAEGNLIDLWGASGMNMTEEELQRKAERGETIVINSKGLGAPQIASHYGGNLINGAQALKMLANEYEQAAQRMTGVFNVPGAKENKKALLGAEAEEQSLHALYLARLEHLMESEFQCISNKGRRIYADSPRRLAIAVGDKGVQDIIITKDMLLEDFRMSIQRTDDEKTSKMMADQSLNQLLMAQIITKADFANNYGRITLDRVGDVIRESYMRTQTAQKMAQQQQQEEQQLQSQMQQANMERMELEKKRQEGVALNEAEKDREAKLQQIIIRTEGQIKKLKEQHDLRMQELEAEHSKK